MSASARRPDLPPLPGWQEEPAPDQAPPAKCELLFLETIERPHAWALEVVVLRHPGREPLIGLRTRVDGRPKSRIEIRTLEELGALEKAIAIIRGWGRR